MYPDDPITQRHFTAPDGARYRVSIFPDADASSPRENDNATVMQTWERKYKTPDEGAHLDLPYRWTQGDDGVRIDLLQRYVSLFGAQVGIQAIAGLERNGYDETLSITNDPRDAIGIVAVTNRSWEMCMGDSPLEGGALVGNPADDRRTPSVQGVMRQDVDAYNAWASGAYVGYVVQRAVTWQRVPLNYDQTMTTWEDVIDGACWGFDDEEYAMSEAIAQLPAGSVETEGE